MKKIITLCFFALALIGSVQTIDAQEKFKIIEEKVKADSKELKGLLNLDDNQTAMVWRTMLAKEKTYFSKISGSDQNNAEVIALKDQTDAKFNSKMSELLTESQYEKFKTWLNKKSKKKY